MAKICSSHLSYKNTPLTLYIPYMIFVYNCCYPLVFFFFFLRSLSVFSNVYIYIRPFCFGGSTGPRPNKQKKTKKGIKLASYA